jgi:hypothetical protein
MSRRDRELLAQALRQVEALVNQIETERAAEREYIEALERRHSEHVERLLAFMTTPDQALLYARQRELEVDEFVRKTGGSEFDELPVGQARRFAREELAARGVSDDEIAAARSS